VGTLIISDKALGCSTSIVRLSGMIERLFRGEITRERVYYKKYPPKIDWQFMLVIGIFIGAAISSIWSGTFSIESIPYLWGDTYGQSAVLRYTLAVFGGILIGFGARFAGGCTSGHSISGTSQLAVGSWVATIFFFIGGIVATLLLFRGI